MSTIITFSYCKRFFLFTLIGALLISALIAIIIVLFGEINDTALRVMYTLVMVIVHSLISLAFIWNTTAKDDTNKVYFAIDVIFLLVVASFITSVIGIWNIITGSTVANLYQTYLVIGLASLLANSFTQCLNKQKYLDTIIYANFGFISLVVLMLMPSIHITDAFDVLGEMYYRLLGATAIVVGTLSILTIILYKLYNQKHPQQLDQTNDKKKTMFGPWFWILLLIVIVLTFLGLNPIFWMVSYLLFLWL